MGRLISTLFRPLISLSLGACKTRQDLYEHTYYYCCYLSNLADGAPLLFLDRQKDRTKN